MSDILQDYIGKLVRVRTTERDNGDEVSYVGRLSCYEDALIELTPGMRMREGGICKYLGLCCTH